MPVVGLSRVAGLFIEQVAASLADGWQDFAGDPILKLHGFGFVRAHDELVEAALGDKRKGAASMHTYVRPRHVAAFIARKP